VTGNETTVEIIDTIIVGAGFAGIGLAIQLKRAAKASFRVLERAEAVGGTWRANRYPGVACDIPSHLYSFSFRTTPTWSHFFAEGAEILRYLEDSVHDEGIGDHLRLGHEALSMRWDDSAEVWNVLTDQGPFRCRSIIIATGKLSEKRVPELPGLDTFAGPVVHTSEWPSDIAFDGLRVALVGTGASAVQLLPRLAKMARKLVVFQRSAAWVVPRVDREYTLNERDYWARNTGALDEHRRELFWDMEAGFVARLGASDRLESLRALAHEHLSAQISDPVLVDALTPDYEIGCKRVLLSDDYYAAFEKAHVRLEPSAIARVDRAEVTSRSGGSYEVDAIVLATGFLSTEPPIARRIWGRAEHVLADAWSDGMVAHCATTVAGFPNLFVIGGPNASLGHNSAIHMIETQIEYVLGALDVLDSGASSIEVRQSVQDESVRSIDRRAASTVWLTGRCRNWYVDERSRRLTLLWPDTASAFRDHVRRFDADSYEVRRSTRAETDRRH
jgi:cation diffusion facilitator CzcD-associated flavoprotein CzcO